MLALCAILALLVTYYVTAGTLLPAAAIERVAAVLPAGLWQDGLRTKLQQLYAGLTPAVVSVFSTLASLLCAAWYALLAARAGRPVASLPLLPAGRASAVRRTEVRPSRSQARSYTACLLYAMLL